MTDKWKSIFKGSIENRSLEIEIYDEGGFRIHTTQAVDDPGIVYCDASSSIIIPPKEQSRKITIEGENPDEICKDLLIVGFSESAANEILSKLPV